ncbi:hypothetical protein [Sphingomonas qomolangmaensis]|uniref:DUF4123 domain-containing protein n=1 Tax=Sphingomonas qomolangmaensis TaxID=2918765 RepID=A0ABY5L9L3_9SPHN|nr:hypothetical protein [Sphingomonas qomolangmaensis]UUL82547.1 hypothetical protein NMP03_15470 [Sphingomonas qomolangmaensis]
MGAVISACTKKKSGAVQASASNIVPGTIEEVGAQWIRALQGSEALTSAAALYQGSSHTESQRAARNLDFPHLIVSAGLGLISADAPVPHYAATILAGNDSVLALLSGGDKAARWWRWLQANSPLAQSLDHVLNTSDGPCLIALPQPYLAMIADEVLALPPAALERVRLFSGMQAPQALAHLQMPYDERLDDKSKTYRGTRQNFASRALRHFAETILPGRETQSAAQHALAVDASLADWTAPELTVGQRKTDTELRAILSAHWDAMGGRSTRMLRLLRDDLGIACEQGRFAGLMRDMRATRGGTA